MSHTNLFFFLGSLLALLSVVLGAFAAHALKHRISQEMLSIFEVAVRYQMYHALGLIALALAFSLFSSTSLVIAGWLFVIGTLFFSGSLYLLVLSGNTLWGAVTPVGGILWILGWLSMCYASFHR